MANKYNKLLKKANKILSDFKVYHGQVYKRFIVQVGGDPLIGKPASVTKNDVDIVPPPAIFYPKYQGISQNNEPYIVGNVSAQIGDIIYLLTATAISEEEIADPGFCFVQITDNYEEEFYIVSSDKIAIEGKILAYQFLVRSRKRKQ